MFESPIPHTLLRTLKTPFQSLGPRLTALLVLLTLRLAILYSFNLVSRFLLTPAPLTDLTSDDHLTLTPCECDSSLHPLHQLNTGIHGRP
ncbi:hypothetical protein IE53DRAFT_195785 [Violaceomyces palustris]|uniref:Uncharacterized protein n=1 Tax=Violaceomyces palustris TaxID=1673888 RepID=A0ACD0NRR0_9BASI|nr:hypothetical protein IE53DRAFT_195785 [Violaceomyces palustris]